MSISISENSPKQNSQMNSVDFAFKIQRKMHRVFFRSQENVLKGNKEAWLITSLLPCMRTNSEEILVEGEISKAILKSFSRIQDIYCSWDPSLRRVEIKDVTPVQKSSPEQKRVGAFFSGGVDSFYTFLKHRDEITDLVFVHGLDINLSDVSLREATSNKIQEVALIFGKNLIEIETNIRELLDLYADWGLLAHGAALAAIGHLLTPTFHRIFIPATHTYSDLFPWGSHPVLDPLWSSETLEFIHDGCEATRVNKVALISQHEIALQSLRVCWENPNGAYNCGRCEKCIRTMINLEVNGALHRCTTFDVDLDIKRISKIRVVDENTRSFVRENLEALDKSNKNKELSTALRKILERPMWLQKLEDLW